MAGWVNFRYADYGDEKSTVTFNIPEVDETTWVGIMGPGGVVQDLLAATDGISLGNMVYTSTVVQAGPGATPGPAGSAYAQRELKWFVDYIDTVTGKNHHLEIPCPDLTLLVPNTDIMNTASGAGAAWVAAFETNARSPETNTVEVVSVKVVGRNL